MQADPLCDHQLCTLLSVACDISDDYINEMHLKRIK